MPKAMHDENNPPVIISVIPLAVLPDIGTLDMLSLVFLVLTLIACLFLFYFIWQSLQGRLFENDIYTEKFFSAADAQQVRSPLFRRV